MNENEGKVLSICAKCRDCFAASVLDQNGEELIDYDGYVPKFMPGEHYGDYVMLDIDISTGQILNWVKPSAEELDELIEVEL